MLRLKSCAQPRPATAPSHHAQPGWVCFCFLAFKSQVLRRCFSPQPGLSLLGSSFASILPGSSLPPTKQGSSPESCKTTLFLVGSSYFLFSTPPFLCPLMFLRWGAGEGGGWKKRKPNLDSMRRAARGRRLEAIGLPGVCRLR